MHIDQICGEQTKSIGYFEQKIQVDGVKLIDDFHVVSDLDCDILFCGKKITGCDLSVTKKGVRIKNLAKKENAEGETIDYCRYVKAVRNSSENLKCVANNKSKNVTIK